MTERQFNWGMFIVGVIVALIAGCLLNLAAGFAALALEIRWLGVVIGALPGLIIGAIGYRMRGRNGLGEGLLTGACVVALIGGICGGVFGGGIDFK